MALDWFGPDPEHDARLREARLALAWHRIALGIALLVLGIVLLAR